VFKTDRFDLDDRQMRKSDGSDYIFSSGKENKDNIDIHGLPSIGQVVKPGDPLLSMVDRVTGKSMAKNYKGMEQAYIDNVMVYSNDGSDGALKKVCIQYRVPRNPVIGDKFSSRHGQKGVCSILYPATDMPFSESGIVPDIIINPHAFPSRMTIGMFVESMAGKAGALHGLCQDAAPFLFSRDGLDATKHFGEQLKAAGYYYYGSEPMYSGILGNEMKADIYIGVVYYQRLRHMVSDKYQVRTTGPIHPLTHQPVQGRKRAGGIRFGEMERDSLLGHGVSFLLHDRLVKCSDYSHTFVCKQCNGMLGVLSSPEHGDGYCMVCQSAENVVVTSIPYVFRYLVTELMAMNIKVDLKVK
jgi:DNA-directed RNA polymerase I subunit RPA2